MDFLSTGRKFSALHGYTLSRAREWTCRKGGKAVAKSLVIMELGGAPYDYKTRTRQSNRGLLKTIVARGGIIAFFIMAFEVMVMISPFAFLFYSVFNPVFSWLDHTP